MAAEALGGKLLRETERGGLEDLLCELRKLHENESGFKPQRIGIPALDDIWDRHGGRLEITGLEGLALLYRIVSVVVSPPRNGTIVIIDADGQFEVTRLSCAFEDLNHIHVYRPLPREVNQTVAEVGEYLLSGRHASMGRDCMGICINGSTGLGADVTVGWRGWLRVESLIKEVPRFRMGTSLEEAVRDREQRQMAVDGKGWQAVSERGEFRWGGGEET